MFSFQVCYNFERIVPIIIEQWDKFAEDGVTIWDVVMTNNCHQVWIEILEDDKIIGVCLINPLQKDTVIVHPYFFSKYARSAVRASKELAGWVFTKFNKRKIQAFIGTEYKSLIKMCKMCGMEEEGLLRKSYLKNGVYWDQVVLGIVKEV